MHTYFFINFSYDKYFILYAHRLSCVVKRINVIFINDNFCRKFNFQLFYGFFFIKFCVVLKIFRISTVTGGYYIIMFN